LAHVNHAGNRQVTYTCPLVIILLTDHQSQ